VSKLSLWTVDPDLITSVMSDVRKFRISVISYDNISGMGRPVNFVFDCVVNSEQTTSASSLCELLVTACWK